MKLILAIVNNDDSATAASALTEEGFFVTKLSTTGGFLRSGNTTLLLGVDDQKFDAAMGVIEKVCKYTLEPFAVAENSIYLCGIMLLFQGVSHTNAYRQAVT